MIKVGTVISRRYEIEEKIGSGGMSIVYRAKDLKLERSVAIKILRDEFCHDDGFVAKFKVEAQAAASLSHINIVNIYDVGNDDKVYYIIMELLEGVTLKEYIKLKGQLDSNETIRIGACIASALECAHNNHIVHRDIKPQNIIVDPMGRIKVADFGIARIATEATISLADMASGSVHYMSPEQAKNGYTNEKSDIYSLGITMFEMITGEVPYKADSVVAVALKQVHDTLPDIEELNSEADTNLINIINKATQKRLIHRYDSAEKMLEDLKTAKTFPDEEINTNNNFDDNAPTIITGGTIWSEKDVLEDEKPLMDKIVVTTAIISAVLAVTLISIMVFSKFGKSIIPIKITVPYIVGMNVEQVNDRLEPLALSYEIQDSIYDDTAAENTILKQTPKEGEIVGEDAVIKIIVCKGQQLYVTPNLENLKYNVAMNLVENAHLKPVMEQVHNSTVPVGIVFKQSPKKGEKVIESTEVILTVSIGKEEKYVIVPDVSRRPLDEAVNSLRAVGLTVGENITEAYNDVVEEGDVIAMTVSPGEKVKEGYEVDLTISLGKEIKPVTKTIEINNILDIDETSAILKVILIQDGTKETLYDGIVTHTDFDGPIMIHVAKMGKATYEVYKDDNLEYTYELVFTQETN